MNNTKKLELTITALKQSLANKVANYEEELAMIRAEASLLLEEQGQKIAELESELNDIKEKSGDVAVSQEGASAANSSD